MGVKVVDGRSVKFRPIQDYVPDVSGGCKGQVSTDDIGLVFTSKDNPDISAHLERFRNWPSDFTYTWDEIVYIIDGGGSITCEGKTHHFYKGDMVLVNKGSVVHWDTPYCAVVAFDHPPLDDKIVDKLSKGK